MSKKIAVLSGDGIGPEICTEAVKVMSAAAARHGSDLAFDFADFGGRKAACWNCVHIWAHMQICVLPAFFPRL